MGGTLTSTLNMALSSLQTNQSALATVSHNIANVNSTDYTRQEVITSSIAIEGFGAGVTIESIRQVADALLQERITEQKSSFAYSQTRSNFMDNLEVVFGTPGSETSLEKTMNNMFNQFSTLANSPDSSSLQLNVVNTADFVVQTIGAIRQDLDDAALRADQLIDDDITAINEALVNIRDLNEEIVSLSISGLAGQNANDLIDERNRFINEIAERINVNVIHDEQGRARVATETGRRLVDVNYVQLERTPPVTGEIYQGIGLRATKSDGTPATTIFHLQPEQLTDGSIKSLIDMRDTTIPDLISEVDELSRVMIEQVNLVHSQGTGVPPQSTFSSGNGYLLAGAGSDITDPTTMNVAPNSQFHISVIDTLTGQPIPGGSTLAIAGGTTPIDIGPGPQTLAGLAVLINANPDISAFVTATTPIDANGDTQLQITANNAGQSIVLSNANATDNPLGKLGMNNFFTGFDSQTIEIRADIKATPALIATARVRASDAGLSFNDNRNMIDLSLLSDADVAFNSAGNLSSRSTSISSYFINISSSLAIDLKDTTNRLNFEAALLTDMEERNGSISGVNLDEELANLILFQRSFQASSRVIAIVDELLETVVNLR